MIASDPEQGLRDVARLMRPRLRHMAGNDPDPLVREMASGLLDGSIESPSRALRFGPYAEALRERTAAFQQWHSGLSDEEQERFLDAGRSQLLDDLEKLDE